MFRTCSKICHICLTLTTSLLVHKLFMPCWQLVHHFSLIFHDLVMNFSWVVTCKWLVRNLFINLFMTCFKLVHASWLVHALFKKLFPISSGVLVLDSYPICSWLLKDVGLFQDNLFKPCSAPAPTPAKLGWDGLIITTVVIHHTPYTIHPTPYTLHPPGIVRNLRYLSSYSS